MDQARDSAVRPRSDPTRWGWIEHPTKLADWRALVDEHVVAGPLLRPPKATSYTEATRPLERIFYLARMAGCQTVLIENRYVDADYRSEYSRHWSRTFEGRPAFARRLHFFRARIAEEEVATLPDPKDAGYIGYVVMRPTPTGPVGRTMITAPTWLLPNPTDEETIVDPLTGRAETRRDAQLALVDDDVHIYGQSFTVEHAAPFYQQDGQFLRCAHVAAWMCHYSAYRRRVVGRELTAAFTEAAPYLSFERYAPAHGMNPFQLQATFQDLHLPAVVYDLEQTIPDVASVVTGYLPGEEPATSDAKSADTSRRTLYDHNLYPIACMYLNSRLPVLVATDDDHAMTLVGWFRDGEGVRFVVNDDTEGPYKDTTPEEDHGRGKEWTLLMVPLPQNIFLQAEEAENSAHRMVTRLSGDTADAAAAYVGRQVKRRKFKLRTALHNSSDYKRDVAKRDLSSEVVALARLAQLPHYVWVTEVHDPDCCRAGTSCVVAEIVHDATSENGNARVDLFMVPGFATTFPPDLPLPPPEREATADATGEEAGTEDAETKIDAPKTALDWKPPVVLSVPDHWRTSLPVCGMRPAAAS